MLEKVEASPAAIRPRSCAPCPPRRPEAGTRRTWTRRGILAELHAAGSAIPKPSASTAAPGWTGTTCTRTRPLAPVA